MTTLYTDDDKYGGIAKEIFKHKQKCSSCGLYFFVAYIEIKTFEEITFNNYSSHCPFCGKNPRKESDSE